MKDDNVYLKQILDAVAKAESFSAGMDEKAFASDAKTQSAVIMQLTLIGELAKRVSPDMKTAIHLPWKDIAGFRDRAVHDYFEIDIEVVWNTLQSDLPVVKKEIIKVL